MGCTPLLHSDAKRNFFQDQRKCGDGERGRNLRLVTVPAAEITV
jgi:hypothetical protein